MISFFFNKTTFVSYLVASFLLGLSVYMDGLLMPNKQAFSGEQVAAFFLLFIIMLAIDGIIKQQYWSANGNYHLFVYVMLSFVLPKNGWDNWMLVYLFLFWLAMVHLFVSIQKGAKEKNIFNAAFLLGLATLFYPEAIVFYPTVWILLILQGQLNFKTVILTFLPIASLALLEVSIHFFAEGATLFYAPDFSQLNLSFEFKNSMVANVWWFAILGIFMISFVSHFIDTWSKSASYVTGINSLLTLGLIAILFGFTMRSASSYAWLLLVMITAILSTRFLEKVKRRWVRELFMFSLLIGVCMSKYKFLSIF